MDPTFRRFSVFYLCYYAALGAYTPYIGRWVASLGHGGYVVSFMLGLWYASRIVGPPAWIAASHRSTRQGWWLVAGTVLTLVCFAGFLFTRSAAALLTVMALFGLFYNAVMPQFEAMTLTALGADTHRYGRLRVWGSIGFLVVASSFGWLLDTLGDQAFPWLTLPLLAATALAAWPHRHDAPAPDEPRPRLDASMWRRPGVRRFLVVALLMQLGFGPFYAFYTLHLQAHHHDGLHIGVLWGLGVLIEIALFWHAPRLIARFGAMRLIAWCLGVTALRWAVTAVYADSFAVMAAAQCVHALSFAIFHACCMRRVVDLFPGALGRVGQGLLYAFSSGIGGVLGTLMAGWLWENAARSSSWLRITDGGELAFLGGAAVTLVALAVHLRASPVPQAAVAVEAA
jgi:PPP family 3-phenylpropionic acid transporter